MRQLALLLMIFSFNVSTAQSINFGDLTTGEISTTGETDTYTFSGTSGDLIRITASCGNNPSNTAFDPELELIFPNGTTEGPINSNNCSDINLDITLNHTGTYQVRVTDWFDDDTGNYNLHLEKLNPASNAVAINFGDVIEGLLENNGEFDLYTFTGTSGDIIRATMSCNSVISNSAFDPELEIFDPSGNSIFGADEGNNCSDINYDVELSQTGVYTIVASDWNGNDFGEYNLFLEKLNPAENAKVINYGEFYRDTLDVWGDIDLFTFTGSSGDLIRVNMACQSDITDSAFDPEIQILAPDGTMYQADEGNNCSDINYDLELTQSGSYTIIATDWNGNNSGKYNLHLDRLLPSNNATSLSYGDNDVQVIDRNGEFDLYTFTGSQGDIVRVNMSCTSETNDTAFDPEAQIITPDGSIFTPGNSNNCGELEYLVELTQSGTHTLIASDWAGNNFGEYEISINLQISPSFTSDTTIIDQGQTVQFNDNSTGDVTSWEWTFEGGNPGTSNLQHPSVTYDTPGVYDVSLIVGNESETETITEQDYITVLSTSLEANFSASGSSTFAGGQIDFTDQSTGDPTSWNWTFEGGNPSTSTEQNPSVIYPNAGVFDVTLTVSDGIEENTKTLTDLITVTQSDNVLELVSSINPQSFDFTDADVQGNYIYAVDDGFNTDVFKVYDISNPSNPTEVFSLNFTFELKPNSVIANGDRLIIGGDGGGADASLVIMDISNPVNPTIVASHLTIQRADGEEPRMVSGLRNIRGDILYTQSGIFNFMSIDISNAASPIIVDGFGDNFTGLIFGGIGSFIIVDDNNAWLDNNDFRHATIDPNGGITMGSKLDVPGGELYDFRITGSNNIGYAATWQSNAANVVTVDFSNQQINDLYTQDIDSLVGGFGFSARMELYEARNLLFVSSVVDFLTLDITNRNQPVPVEVNEGAGILKQDGDILITGGFAGSLNIYQILGGTIEEVSAAFTASQTSIEEGQSIQFTDASTGNPTSWNWTFEGGTPSTSTEQNPLVTYDDIGTFNVSLTVSNGASMDEVVQLDYITVEDIPFPDLVIGSASTDVISGFSGTTVNSSTIIVNTGDLDVTGQITVDYYLSSDAQIDAADISLGSSSITDLAVSESKTLDFSILIPETMEPGDYFFLYEVDAQNVIEESNENNNTSVSAFEILDRIPFIANAIENLQLEQGFVSESIDLSSVFEDPDEDPLIYTAVSDDNSVVTVNISGSSLILSEQSPGFTIITVTANDNEDGSVSDDFMVSINATGNSKPVVDNPLDNVVLQVGFNTETVDLSNVFSDPDGDILELTLDIVEGNSVDPVLNGTTLTLNEQSEGMTSISIRANDSNGGLAYTSFDVNVISNAAPTVDNPLPNIIADEGFVSEIIDLTDVFSDADEDELSYSAVSDDETVVSVSVSNTNLVVVEQGIGEATISVTADDGNGGSATDNFTFTVNDVNEAPVVENPIPNVTYEPGFGTATIELDTVFSDPDGDVLTYTVTSGDETIVTVSISGLNLIITEVGVGSTEVTVVADDGRGESVEDSFTVLNQGNSLPVIDNPIEDQILSQGFVTSSISFDGVFSDPDDDVLTYSVSSLNEDVVTVSITGTNIVFIEQSLGEAVVTISADDGREGIVSDTFNVSIVINTLPEVVDPIEDQVLEEGFGALTINLLDVFDDADGDDLTFEATSSNEEVVIVSISNSFLDIEEVAIGESTITAIADDGKGGVMTDVFVFEVTERSLSVSDQSDFIYPSITDGIINISTQKVIRNSTLTTLDGTNVKSFGKASRLRLNGLADGTYILNIDYLDGSSSQMKIIVRH